MVNYLILKVKSLLVKKPSKKLTWTTEDYNNGRKWALSQPHPFIKGKTVWDLVYDDRDSTYTISNINKLLFNEI